MRFGTPKPGQLYGLVLRRLHSSSRVYEYGILGDRCVVHGVICGRPGSPWPRALPTFRARVASPHTDTHTVFKFYREDTPPRPRSFLLVLPGTRYGLTVVVSFLTLSLMTLSLAVRSHIDMVHPDRLSVRALTHKPAVLEAVVLRKRLDNVVTVVARDGAFTLVTEQLGRI